MINCENCANYYYDEDFGYYTCAIDLDEDEMGRFIKGNFLDCPYYIGEYDIVKKQN